MIGDNVTTWLKQYSERVLQRWAPLLVVRNHEQSLSFDLVLAGGCKQVAMDSLPDVTPFSQVVALIDDQHCSFRLRYFPVDALEFNDLDEAVELDIGEWSPFEESCFLSYVERDAGRWRVSVWVWQKSVELEVFALMPAGLACTHVMPESAWHVAQVKTTEPVFLMCGLQGQPRYFLLSPLGLPLASVCSKDTNVVQRFWKSLRREAGSLSRGLAVNMCEHWIPEALDVEQLQDGLRPRASLLARARLQGVKDWVDPVSWRKPLLAFLSLFVVWVVADAAVLQYQADVIRKQLSEVNASAQVVLNHRARVDVMNNRLLSVRALQHKQGQAMFLLAELSKRIPNDIWLDILQLKSNELDLSGQGKDVSRLLVLLEKIEGVEKVVLLNEIRPDARTGIENVQLRLILSDMPEQDDAGV